ncbi:hypothetical protein EUGRSUZ_C02676 [Eucalyptus grandis]|uniref:Uncharacterized protein n=2 Tax=Eucalyptus grandis TaxID=71139 RepID=A0ACC3LI83_EUCGR|nr:hypothetical protein EUGRSUZ_C02676 [Eucalyptus grandis]
MDSESDFCVGVSSFVLQLSSADELFSDGKILPDEIRRDGVGMRSRCPSHPGSSSALNCDVAKSRGLIRLLQFLSRSNSTGSVPNPKDKFASKDNPRQNLQKQPSISSQRWSSETVSLFGLGSLFCDGKVRKKKKRVILINLLC